MKFFEKVFQIITLALIVFYLTPNDVSAQIPFGKSFDTINLDNGERVEVHYFKPDNYDPNISPLVLWIHGSGSNPSAGENGAKVMDSLSVRKKALIVSPSMRSISEQAYIHYGMSGHTGFTRIYEDNRNYFNTNWNSYLFKQIYRHVLVLDNRNEIPTYIAGFSRGGQAVARHMLIREGIKDSIPIKGALVLAAGAYTPCEKGDFTYYWPFGVDVMNGTLRYDVSFICEEEIKNYYQSNLQIIVGVNDGGRVSLAQDFYNYSEAHANQLGCDFNWHLEILPGIGHEHHKLMKYNDDPSSRLSVAEKLLFDSSNSSVPFERNQPESEFTIYYDGSLVTEYNPSNINCTDNTYPYIFQPNCSSLAHTYKWEINNQFYSDNITSLMSFSTPGEYVIKLTVTDQNGIISSSEQTIKVYDSENVLSDFEVEEDTIYNTYRFANFSASADRWDKLKSISWDFGFGSPLSVTTNDPSSNFIANLNIQYPLSTTYSTQYDVTMTLGHYCTNDSPVTKEKCITVINPDLVSNNENQKISSLTFNDNQISITIDNSLIGAQIEVFDVLGKRHIIQQLKETNASFNINLPTGTYIIGIRKENYYSTKKFIVSN